MRREAGSGHSAGYDQTRRGLNPLDKNNPWRSLTTISIGSRPNASTLLRPSGPPNSLLNEANILQEVFGKEKSPCRLVYGVASLPLGTPVEVIFEVST